MMIGPLLADHFFCESEAERLDIGAVGQIRVGHDSRRIRIDEHHFEPVGLQRLARLRAGIVELAGLADDDRPGAYDQNAVDVFAAGHSINSVDGRARETARTNAHGRLKSLISFMKSSNR